MSFLIAAALGAGAGHVFVSLLQDIRDNKALSAAWTTILLALLVAGSVAHAVRT